MSVYCPITKERVVYLTCQDCDKECQKMNLEFDNKEIEIPKAIFEEVIFENLKNTDIQSL